MKRSIVSRPSTRAPVCPFSFTGPSSHSFFLEA